jgi:hypothetical protein
MADEISKAVCGAYRDILNTGVAQAKTGSQLREAKREAYKNNPTDEGNTKRKQDIEAQRAYFETVMHEDYDEITKVVTKQQDKPDFEKEIPTDIMDLYTKGLK